ncbi:hypothetical protein ZTR_03986 [Talaromyces verruculosus]|nr:hypothetical protein ZTR_03986 [Talaromyces verruculosus]
MTKKHMPDPTRGDSLYNYRVGKLTSPQPPQMDRSSSMSSPALGVRLAPISSQSSPRLEVSASPGYLGSTSFSAVLSEHQKEIPADVDVPSGTAMVLTAAEPDPDCAQSAFRILALLYNLKFFDSVTSRLYASKWYKVLPPYIVDKTLYETRRVYDSFESARVESRIREFALQIFQNSSRPIPRAKTMTVDEYIATFTGRNTRWETIALILATAGCGLFSVTERDPVFTDFRMNGDTQSNVELKEKLVLQVSDATTNCLMFCDHAASSNEIFAYAQYADVIMKTQQYGDSSYQAWRRLSDLAATVYASGLHKVDGPADENCPFFLKQLRRNCFAAAFFTDKCVATFVGRPPLINYRYCSLALPYDVDDDVLFSGGDVEQEVLLRVDVNGWDKNGVARRPGVNRIRLQLSICREEILELALGEGYQRDMPRKAEQILERAQKAWSQCPTHLRYDCLSPEALARALSDGYQMMFLLYVDYLHSQFLLHRAVVKHTNVGHVPLFDTARQLLSTVLRICNDRDAKLDRSKQDSWVMLYYGLPSACVLAFEILRQNQKPGPHPVVLPRSEVIRNLSVFVSCLAWVASPSPSHGNYAACKEVEKKLSRILDQILEPFPTVTPHEDLSFVENVASGLEPYLDWNQFNSYDFNSDYFSI